MSNKPAGEALSDNSGPIYRVAPGGKSPETWVVAETAFDKLSPAVITGFATRGAAQVEADRLNAIAETFEAGNSERRDEALRRMLQTGRK